MTTETKAAIRCTPVIFSAPMVRAILAGKKTQTRRALKNQPTFAAQPRFLYGPGHAGVGWYCCEDEYPDEGSVFLKSRYGHVGDRLWVKETWQVLGNHDGHPIDSKGALCSLEKAQRLYRADATPAPYGLLRLPGLKGDFDGKWRSPMRMHRWASRITLELTEVRIQPLQKISEEDAIAEGVDAISMDDVPRQGTLTRRDDYRQLWNKLNEKRGFGWAANPWVFALTFKPVEGA